SQRSVNIRGIDYIPEMIDNARTRLARVSERLMGQVEFAQGDVTALDEQRETYDKVVSIRVLINLGCWERQLLALTQCSRVLKKGGTLLLSEATIQGWEKLNQFRREWGLPDIPMPPFNFYLDEERLTSELPEGLRLVETVNFASTYYVGTRLLK